jgi:hypothetical protein
MEDNFSNYARQFERLTVSELDRNLVDVATRVFAAPMQTGFIVETEEDAACLKEIRDEEFDLWCLRSGVRNPGAERRKREAAEAAELERIRAAKEQALDAFWRGTQD